MQTQASYFDHIVIGLGGIGSAAAYWSAARGQRVLGLEQFELGHERGASQDHSRILRLSYHTPAYVRLAKEAYDAWRTVEEESDEQLIIRNGGLDIGPRGGVIPMDDYASSMDAESVPYERLDAREIMRRWPQFRLTDEIEGLYQRDGGLLPAARCNAAHRSLAQQRGATLLENTPVTGVRPIGDEVEVVAGGHAYRAKSVMIAADAWTNELLAHLGHHLPLRVTQEQVTYFDTPHVDDFAPERFPVWIWFDDPCFYGFPAFGERAAKVAQDVGGREVTARTRTFEPDEAALARVMTFIDRYLPSARGPIMSTKTCLYTLTPDRDFVIDAVPGAPGVFVALGSAHAFKFASLIGRILSELAVDGATKSEIDQFRFDRPILGLEDPPTHYMI